MRRVAFALAAFFAAFACACAFAERADREKEIVAGSDHLLADFTNRTSVYEGSVVVTQGTMRMTANKVTVKEDAEHHKFYVAYGAPVTFRQKRDKVDEWIEGYAERAEFDDRAGMLKLFNRAKVKSNQNEIMAEFISYDMNKELAEVTGAAPGAPPPATMPRVKMTIVPQKKPAAGAPPAKDPGLALKPDAGAP